MKTLKRLEIVAILLFVTIIIFASFFGIYKKEDFRTVNLIKDYNLGMQFTDARILKMAVSTAEEEIIYDSEGNVVEKDEKTEYTEQNGYKIEKVKVNLDENLKIENFESAKKILKRRLKEMNVGEYKIELNKETGELSVKIQENNDTDEIISHLKQKGEFTIIDDETKEVLLNNSQIETINTVYGAGDKTGTTIYVYLQIEFNQEGAKKLEEISGIYIESSEKQENEAGEIEEVDTTKYVSVQLDGSTLKTTCFGEKMNTGVLSIPITQVSDNEELTEVIHELSHITTIVNSGMLPIEYDYSEETVGPEITIDIMLILKILIPLILLLIICIVKFGVKGFISVFLQIGYIAVVLLVLRYTNVVITIEGVIGIIFSGILNYAFTCVLLDSLNKKGCIEWNLIGKFALKTIPVYVISIILSFYSLNRVNSLGMTVVWGSIMLYVYNLLITRNVFEMLKK